MSRLILSEYPKREDFRNEPVPLWLENAVNDPVKFIKKDFLSKKFLQDSLYYACAGADGKPIKYWSGLAHSFIYIDSLYDFDPFPSPYLRGYDYLYKVVITEELSQKNIIKSMGFHKERKKKQNIYSCLIERSSAEDNTKFVYFDHFYFSREKDLILDEKRREIIAQEIETKARSKLKGKHLLDELPSIFPAANWDYLNEYSERYRKKHEIRENNFRDISKKCLAVCLAAEFSDEKSEINVYLYKRNVLFNEQHGPKYLCVTFIKGGGLTYYYHFFNRNKIVPRVLCILSPGMGDWIGIYHNNGIFKKLVINNPGGLPPYLMQNYDFFESYQEIVREKFPIPSLWMYRGRRFSPRII